MDTAIQSNKTSRKRISDLLFILWAGGAALLSYSLVYMLRKPYTAAAFEDLEVFNMDYKVGGYDRADLGVRGVEVHGN